MRELFTQSETEQSERKNSYEKTFRAAFIDEDEKGLNSQITYSLSSLLNDRQLGPASLQHKTEIADLRYPLEWYPGTRTIQRVIHLHVGPTNSGKTYQALKRLEQAESAIYAGPLRLLAHEVYTRLNAKGKACQLITGDDIRTSKDASTDMISCTVEMVPTNKVVDVGVIDEIQMLGDKERGWAWTQALLGLRAKELHLCGEARTVPLVREIAAQTGETLEIHHYERLSPLKAASQSLNGDLRQLRKGDCLVVFSRKEIHALKSEIQSKTKKRVAIVYGSLPPETRANQARLFNDPNNDYDYLVASDAIGMGLNLDIKRIVFESTFKFDGKGFVPIPTPHLKQIAGRAGRYRIAPSGTNSQADQKSTSVASGTVGLVTSLEQMDYARVREAMQTEPHPVMTAGIFPPTDILIRFAAYYAPGTPFSHILANLHEIASLDPRYHLCGLRDQIEIANVIDTVKDLTIYDRIIFCASPAALRHVEIHPITIAFAKCVAQNTSGSLLDIPNLHLEILDRETSMDKSYLASLEILHKALILYIWLSYRFVGVFKDQAMAFYVKNMVEEKIDEVLAILPGRRKNKLKTLRQLAMFEEIKKTFRNMKMEPTPTNKRGAFAFASETA